MSGLQLQTVSTNEFSFAVRHEIGTASESKPFYSNHVKGICTPSLGDPGESLESMGTKVSQRVPRVLVVEDNPMDAYMIKLALKRGGFSGEPTVVEDGEPALALLRQSGPYQNEPLPDLVILDLNLKRIDGPEVLSYIRATESLRNLNVVVLSSSPEDVMRSKAAAADGYFEKPADVDEYFAVGKTIWSQFSEKFAFGNEKKG